MPKYYEYKIAGYYLYFTSYCVIECMHVHASDRKLTEIGSAKFFVKDNGKYVGIDTSSGFIWTEDFSDIESCVAWLRQKHDIHDRLEKLATWSVDFDTTV